MIRVDVLTLFPELIEGALNYSIPFRAQKAGLIKIVPRQIRDFAIDRHGTVDDTPYGGGPGMVMRVDVVYAALENVDPGHKAWRVMLSPEGKTFHQRLAEDYAKKEHLILLCGRYEGFDARVDKLIDEKVSLGNFVLSGGELAALAIIDAVTRLVPGALGNKDSLKIETHNSELTDYPQYTRPEVYLGEKVPEILLSGDHAKIDAWRQAHRSRIEHEVITEKDLF